MVRETDRNSVDRRKVMGEMSISKDDINKRFTIKGNSSRLLIYKRQMKSIYNISSNVGAVGIVNQHVNIYVTYDT